MSTESNDRVARVKDYFRKGDAGDATIIEMFTDDIELAFPKFGVRSGKQAVGEFVQGLLGQLASLQHSPDDYTYIAAGDTVVVEGWESGVMKDGVHWPVKGRTDGRFCNVFRFRGDLISQLHIYVDPDFTGQDEARFYWGAAAMSARAVSDLDRPIWASLASSHAHLGFGDALARRYVPEVVPFAAVASETPAAFQALGALLQPHEHVGLLCEVEAGELRVPNVTDGGIILQMVAEVAKLVDVVPDDEDVIALGDGDAPEMLALAQHAKPGPFGARTHETGRYIGIRDQGRLVAMAGERMRVDGHVEISSVSVDDAWRGRGLAGRLVRTLGRQIALRGDTPFLHVYGDNAGASALYKRLGFVVRRSFFVVQVRAAG